MPTTEMSADDMSVNNIYFNIGIFSDMLLVTV